MSGVAALNAGPDGAPRYVPSVVVDKLTGQMLASMIGMALFHRERTGQGQEVHVPMLETMLSFLLVEHLWGAVTEPAGAGARLSTHADAASAAICDAGRLHLGDRGKRCALAPACSRRWAGRR